MSDIDSDLENGQQNVKIHDIINGKRKRGHNHDINGDINEPELKKPKIDDNVNSFLEDKNDDDNSEDSNDNDSNSNDGVIQEYGIEMNANDDNSDIIEDNVDFEMMDMYDKYYNNIFDLINASDWDKKKLHSDMLTDIIVKQEEIGGVLVSNESILGFITCLSYKQYFEHLSLGHIKRFLENKIKNNKKKKVFNGYFDKYNVGIVLFERPLNIPLSLTYHVYNALIQDMEYAQSKKNKLVNDKQKEMFKYDYFVFIVKYRWSIKENKNNNDESNGNGNIDINNDIKTDKCVSLQRIVNSRKHYNLVYEHMEDEFIMDECKFCYAFERSGKVWNICIIDKHGFNEFIQKCRDNFD